MHTIMRHHPVPVPVNIPPAISEIYRLNSAGDGEKAGSSKPRQAPDPLQSEDLPYKVELWNEARTSVELILAVTANGSIGYAAYYAATREFSHRYITLRHKNSIISRWNGPGN